MSGIRSRSCWTTKSISAPNIREPITGGRGQISGSFTARSATDLAVLLRAGALPAPLTVVEERSIGPDLGADAIRAGAIALAVGFVLVMADMAVFYGLFGWMANIAMVANLIIMMAVLSLLEATLTLPGMAGILPTLGMAVDANILVDERIREEVLNGRSPINAMEVGFQRAYTTIVDSNATAFLSHVMLFVFGSGPVRGLRRHHHRRHRDVDVHRHHARPPPDGPMVPPPGGPSALPV
jgi:protein-export membrane protein SecD